MQVLLVEDEPAIADTVIYALDSEGITSHWSSTGEDALKTIANEQTDLILLDIGLPDTNGFDLFKKLRKHSQSPILFLTSRHSEIDQVLGLELGADDYITKPFSPRVLSARVRMHLRRVESQPANAPVQTDVLFQVNDEANRISLRGSLLDLSRYEYRLLALLIKHPSRIYSRDQLMEMVWENPESSFDRTIDTHMKVIRKKIKDVDPTLKVIKTHRGIGYSFEVPK